MTHLLFICSLNQVRSLTAEHLFASVPGIKVASAGTQKNARVVVGAKLLSWADRIFVMEHHHKEKLMVDYPELVHSKEIIVLDIPNGYEYMDPELVSLLKMSLQSYLS